jgi:hypothetical protein
VVLNQPPPAVLPPLEPLPVLPPAVPLGLGPLPVVRAPESLTEVATIVPLEFFTPWTTTASPGWSEVLETPRLLVADCDAWLEFRAVP